MLLKKVVLAASSWPSLAFASRSSSWAAASDLAAAAPQLLAELGGADQLRQVLDGVQDAEHLAGGR
jgi:hypothetical protein